jgi:tetraacyldisaccharide 4'-kinase
LINLKKKLKLVLPWKKNKLIKYILFPLALFYGGVIFLRNLFYSTKFFISKKLPTKVLSIGNITTGGTGKTPAVIFLTKLLSEKGIKCAILSRGYGRKTTGTQLVTDGKTQVLDWRKFGDEPSLMAKLLPGIPIVVDSKRYRGGMFLVDNFKPEVIILDDAFQHRSIERDLDIVLINSKDNKKDYKLLPYGVLREPASSLKRADVLIFTKTNLMAPNDFLNKIVKSTKTPVYLSTLKAQNTIAQDGRPIQIKKGLNAIALSAIADTKGFLITLKQTGITVVEHFDFLDHHNYQQSDIDRISKQMKRLNVETLITTEKDMIKLADLEFNGIKIYTVKVLFVLEEKGTIKLLDLIQNI